MKPIKSSVFARLAPLILSISLPLLSQVPVGDLAAHRGDEEVLDSLSKAMPFLGDKVSSTIKNGASQPVAFHGTIQMRSLYTHSYNLADSSFLYLARQGFMLGGDEPVIKLGMIVSPNRNTVLWSTLGLSASYQGVNSNFFLKPNEDGYTYSFQHHNANRSFGVYEDLSAGMAIRTKPISFMLNMGAVNWTEFSPLSVYKAQAKNFAWWYYPYEMEEPISSFYKDNLITGELTGRSAWHKKSFQGINLSLMNAPGDIQFSFLYGSADPYDMYDRASLDMGVDLGYAGDEGGIVETGTGDPYRKSLYYRIAKRFNSALTVGFSNGYVRTNDDIVNAGFKYDYIFNSNFDVGLYNSSWNIGNETVNLDSKANYNKILSSSDTVTATTVGEGFWLDPTIFSVDFSGDIKGKFTYLADIGFTMVETTYVAIDNASYSTPLATDGTTFNTIANKDSVVEPGSIYSTRTSDPLKHSDIAFSLKGVYHSNVDVGLEVVYAGKNYYSPYSYVAPIDGFFAKGSNEYGESKFLGSETSPYTSNMLGTELFVKPNIPWYGHLKVKYGINTQPNSGRDIVFFPYRLNGASVVHGLNRYYNKWGIGKLTETYDFDHHQGGIDKKGSQAQHPIDRVGDESYGSYTGGDDARVILSPTSGGLRADANSLYEGFVPYGNNVTAMILNHFSKSSLVSQERNISEVWNDAERKFVDNRNVINATNDNNGVAIIEDGDTTYYKMSDSQMTTDKGDTVTVDTVSATGFVPTSKKSSFHAVFDWGLDISKYIPYDKDLILSLYYEFSGVNRGFKPMSFSTSDNDNMMISHYLYVQPAIAATKSLYFVGLFGLEKWLSGKSWIPVYDNNSFVGFEKSKISTTDYALGFGFDWDFMKRVSLHGRYKWYTHTDDMLPEMRYNNNSIAFELKAFF